MDTIDNLIEHFKKPETEIKDLPPTGYCPICWGYQDYDSKIRKIFKDKQIDVNNHVGRYMKIQKFVVEHIDGIKLLDEKTETCPTCGGIEEKAKSSIMANKDKEPKI